MSHYAEYKHGSMSDSEFNLACNREFAGDNDEFSDCYKCPHYKPTRVNMFSVRKQCEYDYCIRDEEEDCEE